MTNAYGAPASSLSQASGSPSTARAAPYELRAPRPGEAVAVHDLVASCPPLDRNSLYCNLLQCTHFAPTSAIALAGPRVAGFVSGYCPPEHTDTLFVWQVAVAPEARGRGLGKRLIRSILERPQCRGVRFISATVTPGNDSSKGMFESLARELGTALDERPLFDAQDHFGGRHDAEHELRVGPFRISAPIHHPT